jgi:two-component system phosphate regulon response regulator PhoB
VRATVIEEEVCMARVLIVEDEEALAILLRYNLEAQGIEVIEASSGEEAERKAGATRPDLILLDWVLPGLSGIELCRRLRLRAETRHIPILLLTAKTDASDRLRGLEAGADDFIVKPFALCEILARVQSLLGARASAVFPTQRRARNKLVPSLKAARRRPHVSRRGVITLSDGS